MIRVKNYQKFTERALFYVIQSVIALCPLSDFLVIFDSGQKAPYVECYILLKPLGKFPTSVKYAFIDILWHAEGATLVFLLKKSKVQVPLYKYINFGNCRDS